MTQKVPIGTQSAGADDTAAMAQGVLVKMTDVSFNPSQTGLTRAEGGNAGWDAAVHLIKQNRGVFYRKFRGCCGFSIGFKTRH